MTVICHLSTVHSGLDTRIALKECATLRHSGHDCFLVIPASAADVGQALELGIRLVPLSGMDAHGRLHRATVGAVAGFRAALATGARIFHVHDPELIPLAVLLKLMGKRVVYDAHEDLGSQIQAKHWIPRPLRKLAAALARSVEVLGARSVDAVVAATPFIGQRFAPHARRVAVVCNFPRLEEFPVPRSVAWRERDRVAYIGGISEARGIREMLQAVDLCEETLVLGGLFDPPQLEHVIGNEPGWKQVEFLGYLSREGVARQLSRCYAGLVTLAPTPNHLNSYPIKMFEYMAAGIPVIASDFPLWRGIIDEAGCGICVDESDPRSIAEAICRLRDHPDEAARMGESGRRAVVERFNWQTEGAKLNTVYTALSSHGPGS